MKKIGIILAILVILGGVAGAFLLLNKKDTKTGDEKTAASFTAFDACNLLSKDKAASILGTPAALGQEPSPSSSDDLTVTNCVFNNNAGNFKDIVSVSLLVRSPATQVGVDSNASTFNDVSLVGDIAVEGYGEKASWNSTTGQLNILKDKNWMIVTFGKSQPASRTLDDTKKAADSIFN